MRNIPDLIRRFFAVSDSTQEVLSSRWRPGVNKRTTIILVVVGTIFLSLYLFFFRAPAAFPVGELVTVESEVALGTLAERLEGAGVVRSEFALRAILLATGNDRSVRAGDYLFKKPRNVLQVARALSTGAFGLEPIRIRIPEGSTARSMAIVFQSKLLRFNVETFLLEAQSLEGYLFPDTYFFLPNASEKTVLETMHQNFEAKIEPYISEIEASGRSLQDIVIMASLIEREAHDYEDRRLISGVLWNRIDIGMALQVDATFLYQLGKSTFTLTLEDLQTDSPYNTYTNKGLPPGPIGSPSLDAIEAAIHPTENDYLFYLADMDGVTHYSKTYAEHLRKKRLYLD